MFDLRSSQSSHFCFDADRVVVSRGTPVGDGELHDGEEHSLRFEVAVPSTICAQHFRTSLFKPDGIDGMVRDAHGIAFVVANADVLDMKVAFIHREAVPSVPTDPTRTRTLVMEPLQALRNSLSKPLRRVRSSSNAIDALRAMTCTVPPRFASTRVHLTIASGTSWSHASLKEPSWR